MASRYLARAQAIQQLLVKTRKLVQEATGYSNRLVALTTSLEIVNRITQTFDFAPDTVKQLDAQLNVELSQLQDEADINKLYSKVLPMMDKVIQDVNKLVAQHEGAQT